MADDFYGRAPYSRSARSSGSRSRSRPDRYVHPDGRTGTADEERPDSSPWHWLLWVPIVIPLMPVLYNDMNPRFLGLPFYYWSQLAFAGLASLVITVVHLATKDR
ncbi:DUF3311 domain-containing protein [Catenuloplanes atrovinosus]|uniref:DUF3311 domain-containing protein n=1 Tax=Catenuloplanes atrovinosus TaxID=137266 RepID=A0AAE3YS25_9ACTN|nr:DUF3311 domain-containing protein [Catenuloplanes atrovinosus]MDR7278600.1 hypothetical protein [Catenuloplanes atrovinosus]